MSDEPGPIYDDLPPSPEIPTSIVEIKPEVEVVPVGPVISDDMWSSATSNWISNHVRNSPIAQSIEAWTYLGTILPHLRNYIEDELKPR